MVETKLVLHITKKIATHVNRHTRTLVSHQGSTLEENCRKDVIRHRPTFQDAITIIA